jgi:hypothetical protein
LRHAVSQVRRVDLIGRPLRWKTQGTMRPVSLETASVRSRWRSRIARSFNPARISGLEPTARAILFHELVHVHQYRALGLETFLHEVHPSVVAYRNYRTIPLEGVAYEAQGRYVLNSEEAFSVAEMLQAMRRWSGA